MLREMTREDHAALHERHHLLEGLLDYIHLLQANPAIPESDKLAYLRADLQDLRDGRPGSDLSFVVWARMPRH